MSQVIAIDVGGTAMKCALVDAAGGIVHTERHPTGADRGPDAVVGTILDVAAGLAARAAESGTKAGAVGIVVPGVVDGRRGVAVWSANVGFREVPLRDLLSTHLGLPAVLGHDVRAGGAAEARLGAGRGYGHVLFLAIGTGIAGAHVVDGVAFAGAHGAAGEPAASAVWAEAVDALADGLHTAVTLNDPEVVVVGGGLAEAGDSLLVPLDAALAAKLTFQRKPAMVRAALGDEAGCLGAGLLALSLVDGVG